MDDNLSKQMLRILELSMKQQEQIKDLIANMEGLSSIQHILVSIMCQYDRTLKDHLYEQLSSLVNRPGRTENRFFEETLNNLLLIAQNPEKECPDRSLH